MPASAAVGVEDHGRVVVDAGRAAFEERADDRRFPARAPTRRSDSVVGPGMRLRQIEEGGILFAAEILRAEQLLQADDLRAAGGRLADALRGFGQVGVRIRRARHLDQTDFEGSLGQWGPEIGLQDKINTN